MAGRKNEPHATELLPPSERLPKLEAELEQANFAIEKFHDQLSALYRTLKETAKSAANCHALLDADRYRLEGIGMVLDLPEGSLRMPDERPRAANREWVSSFNGLLEHRRDIIGGVAKQLGQETEALRRQLGIDRDDQGGQL